MVGCKDHRFGAAYLQTLPLGLFSLTAFGLVFDTVYLQNLAQGWENTSVKNNHFGSIYLRNLLLGLFIFTAFGSLFDAIRLQNLAPSCEKPVMAKTTGNERKPTETKGTNEHQRKRTESDGNQRV